MRLRKNVLIAYVIFLGLGLIIISGSLNNIPQNVVSFSITSPNAPQGDIKIPSAVCFAKTTTTLFSLDSNGNLRNLSEDNSPFLTDNPQYTLDLADTTTGKEIGQMHHALKMRCNVGIKTTDQTSGDDHTLPNLANQLICEDPLKGGECQTLNKKIFVKPSTMTVNVYAQDPTGKSIKVYSTDFTTKDVTIQDGAESDLARINIPLSEIEKNMGSFAESFNSQFEVTTKGTLDMRIEDFYISGTTLAPVKFYVGEPDVPTYLNLRFLKDISTNTDTDTNTNNPCLPPKVLDTKTNTCVTKETQQQSDETKQSTNQNTQEENPNNQDNSSSPGLDTNMFAEFYLCAINGNTDCLNDKKFVLIYAIGFILIALIFIAILASAFKPARPYQ